MNKYILLSFILLSFNKINSQSFKERYANKLFEKKEYYECAPIFEEITINYINNLQRNQNSTLKAAISYYNIKDYQKAKKYFQALDRINKLEDTYSLMYLDCLLRLNDFQTIKTDKLLFKNLKSYSFLNNIKKYQDSVSVDSSKFIIEKLSINSDKGDCFAVEFENKLYFSSSRNNNDNFNEKHSWDNSNFSDLYYFNLSDADKKIYHEKIFSTKFHDGPIYFYNNEIYLTRTNYKGALNKHVEIYHGKDLSNLIPLKFNSPKYNIGHVAIDNKKEILYFSSDAPGGFGGADLYYCTKNKNEWSNPVNLGNKINTVGDELFPFIDSIGGIYFSSNGQVGFGGLDIYYFSPVDQNIKNMGNPINSNFDDFSYNLNSLENKGYFSSDRDNFIDNIYSFSITDIMGILEISIIDTKTKKSIDSVDELYLVEKHSGDSIKIVKNVLGIYSTPVKRNFEYYIVGNKNNYSQYEKNSISVGNIASNDVLNQTINFTQIAIPIIIKTLNKDSNLPLANVDIQLTNNKGEIEKYKTDEFGNFNLTLKTNAKYLVLLNKKGFLDNNSIINTFDLKNQEITYSMQEIKKDIVFKVENILYDLGSADLRESSKNELDKLSNFLLINNNIKIELSSHTDSRSGAEFNLKLSEKRAQSCFNYLISKGISKNNIKAKGYGESKPLNKCIDGTYCNEEDHQVNRRTEVKILSID